MKNYNFVIYLLVLLTVLSKADLNLAVKKDPPKSFPSDSLSNQNSHEEFHSKNDSSTPLHPDNIIVNASNPQPKSKSSNTTVSLVKTDVKMVSKPDILVNSSSTATSTTKSKKVVIAEGGEEVSSQYPIKNKANETIKNITTVDKVTPHPLVTSKGIDLLINSTTPGVNVTQVHKRIHGRPGVSEIVTPTTINTPSNVTTTHRPKKKKPLFTMITGDKETKDSESFIESSATGRDYVLPIVLIILSLPIVGYLIKIIYRRGTEFTERQQYHRMYLIDGMYNSR